MKALLIFIALLLLSSCSLLSPVNAPQQNYLISYHNTLSQKSHSNQTIYVGTIASVPWLNTTKMAYQLNSHEINYFARHQWIAPPSALLKPVIVDALQKSGQYKAVFSSFYTDNYDKRVEIKITDFQQEFTFKPSLYHINLQVILINHHTEKLVKTKNFELLLPCESDNPQGGVKTANLIIERLMPEIVHFIS